jgi:hypothetical protein
MCVFFEHVSAIFNLTFWQACAILFNLNQCDLCDAGFWWILCPEDGTMHFDVKKLALVGSGGSLAVAENDEVTQKLAMLIEGECEGLGPLKAAKKFGYTKQRYFQIRNLFAELGAQALVSKSRGPKKNYRRTSEVVRQIIRLRFLDPESSPQVISQKLKQTGLTISIRSVERVIAEFGLQKKTLSMPSPARKR